MVFQDPMTSLNPLFTVGTQISGVCRRHRGASKKEYRAGDVVTVAGVLAPHEFVNGQQTVANVGVGGDQFELAGVDLTAAGTTIGDPGMTVTPAAAPAGRRSDERRGGKEDRSGDDRGIENRRNSAIPSGRRNRS